MAKNSPAKLTTKQTVTSLYRLNLWFFGIYLLQGLAILLFSATKLFPVEAVYPASDPLASEITHSTVTATASRHLFDINGAYIVAAFIFITAVVHLLTATVYRAQYEADLKRNINRLRWVGYALTGATMMVTIGLVSGIRDIATLILIFTLSGIAALIGFAVERAGQGKVKPNWPAYALACLAGVAPGVIFLWSAWAASAYGAGLSGYVYILFASMVILGGGLAVAVGLQQAQKGSFKDYLYAEKIFMIISGLLITALAWQVFAGALRP
jgi:hypothetical protein